MGKGLKSIVSLGLLGGAAFGGFKAYKEYEYLKETHNNVILFNGEKLIYDEVFEGDSVAAVMSGVEIDLREAEFEADYTNLDLYGMAAGLKVLVPDDIKVAVNGVNKASGIQINVDDSVEGKVLNITYDMTASGLLVVASSMDEEEEEVEIADDEAFDGDAFEEMAERAEAVREAEEEVAEAMTEELTEEVASAVEETVEEGENLTPPWHENND